MCEMGSGISCCSEFGQKPQRMSIQFASRTWHVGVRAIWLGHLSPHWSPGLIQLIWLARRVSPSSLIAPCASLPKLHARLKKRTIPDWGGPVFGEGYTSSYPPQLEPPNKLSRSILVCISVYSGRVSSSLNGIHFSKVQNVTPSNLNVSTLRKNA